MQHDVGRAEHAAPGIGERVIEARPIQSRRPRGRRAILLLAVAGLAACALGFALTRSYPAARYEGMEALRDEVKRQLGPVRVVSHRAGARCNTFMQSIGATCSEPWLSVTGEVPSDRADGLCEAFRSAVSAATGGDVGASSWGPGRSCFVYGVHGQLLVSGGLSSPSSMVLSISLFG